jgi:hypothetical protein
MIGNKIAFKTDITHSLITVELATVPAKNHTGPLCPRAQFLPVSSFAGLLFI